MNRITILSFGPLCGLLLVPFAGCGSSNSSGSSGSTEPTGSSGSSGTTGGTTIVRIDSGDTEGTSSGSSGTVGGGGATGGTGTTGTSTGGTVDGGSPADGGPACLASVAGFTTATTSAPTPQPGACSASDIQAFLAACSDGTETMCDKWLNTNLPTEAGAGTTCGACIISPTNDNGGAWFDPYVAATQHLLLLNPNYAGCIALKDPKNGAACGAAVNDLSSCEDLACDTCTTDTDYVDCVEAANQGGCMTYYSSFNSSCKADLASGGAVQTCFPSAVSNNVDDDYNLILNLICGSGDGG